MQVHSVGNIGSNTNFKSKDRLEKASTFVNMDDSQLRFFAYASATDKEKDKKDRKAIGRTFCAIPIVDTIASGVLAQRVIINKSGFKLAETPLSDRAFAAGNKGLSWALGLGLVAVYGAVKKAVVSRDPSLQNFEQRHPLASFLFDIGAIMGAFALGTVGLGKLAAKSLEKHPDKLDKIIENNTKAANWIDNTSLNKKVLPRITEGISKLSKEAPFVTKAGRFALANSVWLLFGAAVVQMLKYSSQKTKKVDQNYRELKTAQLQTAKHMVNVLSVERDVLVQDNKKMAKDLKHVMNGEKPVSHKEVRKIRKKGEAFEEARLKERQARELEQAEDAKYADEIQSEKEEKSEE